MKQKTSFSIIAKATSWGWATSFGPCDKKIVSCSLDLMGDVPANNQGGSQFFQSCAISCILEPLPWFQTGPGQTKLAYQPILWTQCCYERGKMRIRMIYITLIFLQRGSAYHYPETSCKRKGERDQIYLTWGSQYALDMGIKIESSALEWY